MVAALKLTLLFYLAFTVLLYFGQRKMLYFSTPISNYAKELNITFSVNNQNLQAWQLNPGKSRALMYFGGNAESVEANVDDFIQLFPDHTIFLLTYRGYGGSTGTPTEKKLKSDALAIYDQLSPNFKNISIMGRSLGSGVAVHLAANRIVAKMILVTPYDSILNVAKGIYWMFPLSLLLKDKFESWRQVADLETETLLLIAEQDEVIPAKYGKKLAQYFINTTPKVKVIRHANHNNIEQFREYREELIEFVQ